MGPGADHGGQGTVRHRHPDHGRPPGPRRCPGRHRRRGAELAAEGWLDDPADAVYLTIPELVDGDPAEARELSTYRRARRARRDEYRTLVLPMNFTGMPEPLAAAPVGTSGGRLHGAAGSAGIAEGPARVALTVADAAGLEPGEILVCHTTDPSWVGAMVIARALVIDVGAPASHGAIIARELGVPCVIGTAEGTTRIRTGDRIRVDGTGGTVEILASAGCAEE
jgi:pyruvate,water dikinase